MLVAVYKKSQKRLRLSACLPSLSLPGPSTLLLRESFPGNHRARFFRIPTLTDDRQLSRIPQDSASDESQRLLILGLSVRRRQRRWNDNPDHSLSATLIKSHVWTHRDKRETDRHSTSSLPLENPQQQIMTHTCRVLIS